MAEYKTTVTETKDGGRTIISSDMTKQEAAIMAAKRERTKNMNTSDSAAVASDALDKSIADKKRYAEMKKILALGKHKSMSDEEKTAFIEEYNKLKLDNSFAKGGVVPMNNMAKQMDMFNDGGLMDEGGTVDPVSGNDVPPGSNQEEVRDDIPAQLSEGEFVFPADVVRYFGLEKLMEMRQEAKMGLQRMDDMGQMGNSEEAIMPDNLPFDIDDIDMEDDGLEMAQGGVVHMANGGPVGQLTTGFPASSGALGTPVGQVVPNIRAGTQVVVYGPDGTAYGNAAIAQAAGVTNYTMTPPAGQTSQPTPPTGQATAPVQAASAQFQPAGTKFTPTTTQKVMPTFKETIGMGVPYVDYDPTFEEKTEKIEEIDSPLVETTMTTQQPQDDGGDSRDYGGGTSLLTGEKIAGYSPEEIKSGVASAKDRYAVTGNRGFDLLNVIPGGAFIKSLMPDSVSAGVFGKDPTIPEDASVPPGIGMPVSAMQARNALEQSIGTKITGYVGFEKGDLDPNSGGFFNKDGIAIDPETGGAAKNENGTMNYASVQDFKNAIAAGNKSGWRGGVISSTDYKGLSTKGKANYDKYADLTNNRKGGAVSSKKAAEEAKAKADKARADKIKADKIKADKERADKERADKAKASRDRLAQIQQQQYSDSGGDNADSYGGSGVESGGRGEGFGDFSSGLSHAKGGLVSQMKRSGLASKK